MPVSEKVDVRVALDADLMEQVRRHGLDLSALLEASVRRALPVAITSMGSAAAVDDETEAFDRYIEANGPFHRVSRRR